MNSKKVSSQDRYYNNSLAELFPPVPLSENVLLDIYTRFCFFPQYIKECICREMCWTEAEFSHKIRPPKAGEVLPSEAEYAIVLAIAKVRLTIFLQYLQDCGKLHKAFKANGIISLYGAGKTKDMRPKRY